MKLRTLSEYQKEIARVQAAIDSTNSDFLRMDYGKYKKRLQKEEKRLMKIGEAN